MSIIKIYAEEIELEFKKDTLTLKKENNALSTDFKVTHSSFPFLIIENENTKLALGSSDITSISKKKIIPVTVLELGVRYYGELQQLSVIKGFRKCNLKYSSEILTIIDKPISTFMPIVSVIPGETNPVPYTEESETVVPGSDNWEDYPLDFIGKVFPEVKWQFPMMRWYNKNGIDLEETDSWYKYENHINNFGVDASGNFYYLENIHEITSTYTVAENYNVASAQVFLLSPLYYIVEYLGWKMIGDFTTNEFIRRLLMLSTKDNISKVIIYAEKTDVAFPFTWSSASIQFPQSTYKTSVLFSGLTFPLYTLKYYFKIPAQTDPLINQTNTSFRIKRKKTTFPTAELVDIVVFNAPYNTSELIVEGEIDIFLPNYFELTFIYYSATQQTVVDYDVFFRAKNSDKEYQQMHPTIETGRYVPEWTVGNYLNYLKNQFNLDITINDFNKAIEVNFNENIEENEEPVILEKSLVLSNYDLAANSSFVLKYENDEDIALYISRDSIEIYDNQEDDYAKFLDSKFKFVPRNGFTSELSEQLEDKEGIGLMIYDETFAPYISEEYNGQNLSINGIGGIYDSFWKRWLKFRLNASGCEVVGFFTEIEIAKIYQAKSIFLDNQRYRISSIEYSESTNNLHELKMNLESVNY